MAITAQMVKELREITGAGPLDSKKALEQFDGDIEKAVTFLREKGLAKAAKKLGAGRAINEGVIESYMHFNKRLGVMVEVNCETDFVARTPDFQSLARDIAMQVAAMSPRYLSGDEIPEGELARLETEFDSRDAAVTAVALLDQVFIKDSKKTIRELIKEHIGKLGENIVVSRFSRFELGGESTTASAALRATTSEG